MLKKVKVGIVLEGVDLPVVFTVGEAESKIPKPRGFVVLLMFFFLLGVFMVMVRSFLSFRLLFLGLCLN